jgi:hypothetical protein
MAKRNIGILAFISMLSSYFVKVRPSHPLQKRTGLGYYWEPKVGPLLFGDVATIIRRAGSWRE